jgi:hypothetical protein
MKRQIFTLLAVIVTVSLASGLYAQNASLNTTRSNIKNNKSSMDSPEACVGKIRCADGSCVISFEQYVVSPRDATSGLPTGKRMHKPFVITKELDRSSAAAIRESPTKASTGKVSYSDLSVVFTCNGRTTKLPVINGQFTLPTDGKDDDCDLVVSWSWGESNSGSSSTRYEATFNLAVVNGEYMASKHTKTGHVSLLK